MQASPVPIRGCHCRTYPKVARPSRRLSGTCNYTRAYKRMLCCWVQQAILIHIRTKLIFRHPSAEQDAFLGTQANCKKSNALAQIASCQRTWNLPILNTLTHTRTHTHTHTRTHTHTPARARAHCIPSYSSLLVAPLKPCSGPSHGTATIQAHLGPACGSRLLSFFRVSYVT